MYMYADDEVHETDLFNFIYCTQSPKNVLSFIHVYSIVIWGVHLNLGVTS